MEPEAIFQLVNIARASRHNVHISISKFLYQMKMQCNDCPLIAYIPDVGIVLEIEFEQDGTIFKVNSEE